MAAAIMIWTRNTPPGVEWHGSHSRQGSLREVFSERRFWLIAPLTFFLAGTLLGFQGLWAGPYLFDSLELTDLEAGNVLLLLGIGATAGYAVSGWLADRYGMARVIVVVTAFFILCQVILALHPSLVWVQLSYVVFGFTGSFNVMLVAQARQVFPLYMTGISVTAVNMFAIGGVFLLQWWMGLIIGMFPADASGAYPPIAYSAALLFTASGAFLSLLWYLPMARQKPAYNG
jgi:predicted MFS family arabinose efflux permease